MPISFPTSPAPVEGDTYEYNGKTYQYGGVFWSAVHVADQTTGGSSFQVAVPTGWKEISVIAGVNTVKPMVGVILDYL